MYKLFNLNKLTPLNLFNIKHVDFPDSEYFHEIYPKHQIILHHTVSGPGILGDVNTWVKNGGHINTPIVISRNGDIHQLYSSKYWAHSLGCKQLYLKNMGYSDYKTRDNYLNRSAIAIELDNWGPLMKVGDHAYKTVYGNIVNVKATEYIDGYKGYNYFESYTKEQIISVAQLLLFWNKRYNIPLDYHKDMWGVTKNALDGNKGIWTHASYRYDKSDCHPDPYLISMLMQLKDL